MTTSSSAGCPTPETIAAFVDGTLPPVERTAVEAHLDSCDDCRELVADVATMPAFDARTDPVESEPRPKPRRTWPMFLAAFAAAAVVVLAVVVTRRPRGGSDLDRAMHDLVRAVGSTRIADARLSEPFNWGPPRVSRGAASTAPLQVQDAALQIEKLTQGASDAQALQAAGVAYLTTGDPAKAVSSLSLAAAASPNDPAIRTDLAAARIEAWKLDPQAATLMSASDDVERAATANARSAPVLFDRAVIQESLGRTSLALAAWRDYAALDPASPWGDEARTHIADLEKSVAPITSIGPDDTPGAAQWTALASNEAAAIYRFLDDWLDRWAGNHVASGSPAERTAQDAARALDAAHLDRYDVDLVGSAVKAASPATANGRCLASAIQAMTRSRSAYDRSDYHSSADEARGAQTAFECAHVTTLGARLQEQWALFFAERRQAAKAAADALESEALARGYLRLSARIAYLDGLSATGLARYPEAVARYQHAIDLDTKAGDREQRAAVHTLLATLDRNVADRDGMWAHINEALNDLDACASGRIKYLILSSAEFQAINDGLNGLAKRFSLLLEPVLASWNTPVAYVDAMSLSARLNAQLGLGDAALDAARRGRARLGDLTDDVTRTQYDAAISAAEARALLTRDPAAASRALDPILARIAAGDMPLFLAQTLLVKGQADLAAGRASDADHDWSTAAGALEDQRPLIRDAQLNVARTSDLWDVYGDLIGSRAAQPMAALEIAERARSRALLDSLARDSRVAPLTGDALHSWLAPDATALVYAVLPDALYVWRVTRSSVTLERRPCTPAHLTDLVTRFVANVKSGVAADDRELASLLLPADLDAHPTALLALLPDGVLNLVPFAALTNPRTGHPLAENFVPAIEPSLTVMKAAASAPAPARSALLVGYDAPQPGFHLSRLAGVNAELDAVNKVYGRAVVLAGPSATAAATLAALPSHTVIHFAGHALANEDYPSRTQFFVAPATGTDSTAIRPDDIARLKLLPGTVVVLSTCEGARGRVFRGEGALSLARPFLAAGASAVLGNLWQVDDVAAESFVVTVHEAVRDGQGLADAVVLAQRAAIKAHLPAHLWAGWITLGVNR